MNATTYHADKSDVPATQDTHPRPFTKPLR